MIIIVDCNCNNIATMNNNMACVRGIHNLITIQALILNNGHVNFHTFSILLISGRNFTTVISC